MIPISLFEEDFFSKVTSHLPPSLSEYEMLDEKGQIIPEKAKLNQDLIDLKEYTHTLYWLMLPHEVCFLFSSEIVFCLILALYSLLFSPSFLHTVFLLICP